MGRLGADHIRGETRHIRAGAQARSFSYDMDMVLVDMEAAPRPSLLFGRNRAGVLSVMDRDHGGVKGKGAGAVWLRRILAERQIVLQPGWRIHLLTQPRIWGRAFNPVSFWLVMDQADALRLVVAEVSNTFGDRHSYILKKDGMEAIAPGDWLEADKLMHVSPFQPMEGKYRFRFDIAADAIGIVIDFRHGKGGLLATLAGRRAPLRRAGALGMALRIPLAKLRILGLIHWQAVKLWWRGARFFSRPTPPKHEVS